MKQIKVLLALVLTLAVAMGLCACGGAEEVAPPTTQNNETTGAVTPSLDVNGGFAERPENNTPNQTANVYYVTVKDNAGDPIQGVMINIYSANGCTQLFTEEDGKVKVTTLEEKNCAEINVDTIPEGYVLPEEQAAKAYFEGKFELEFVLQRKTAAAEPMA